MLTITNRKKGRTIREQETETETENEQTENGRARNLAAADHARGLSGRLATSTQVVSLVGGGCVPKEMSPEKLPTSWWVPRVRSDNGGTESDSEKNLNNVHSSALREDNDRSEGGQASGMSRTWSDPNGRVQVADGGENDKKLQAMNVEMLSGWDLKSHLEFIEGLCVYGNDFVKVAKVISEKVTEAEVIAHAKRHFKVGFFSIQVCGKEVHNVLPDNLEPWTSLENRRYELARILYPSTDITRITLMVGTKGEANVRSYQSRWRKWRNRFEVNSHAHFPTPKSFDIVGMERTDVGDGRVYFRLQLAFNIGTNERPTYIPIAWGAEVQLDVLIRHPIQQMVYMNIPPKDVFRHISFSQQIPELSCAGSRPYTEPNMILMPRLYRRPNGLASEVFFTLACPIDSTELPTPLPHPLVVNCTLKKYKSEDINQRVTTPPLYIKRSPIAWPRPEMVWSRASMGPFKPHHDIAYDLGALSSQGLCGLSSNEKSRVLEMQQTFSTIVKRPSLPPRILINGSPRLIHVFLSPSTTVYTVWAVNCFTVGNLNWDSETMSNLTATAQCTDGSKYPAQVYMIQHPNCTISSNQNQGLFLFTLESEENDNDVHFAKVRFSLAGAHSEDFEPLPINCTSRFASIANVVPWLSHSISIQEHLSNISRKRRNSSHSQSNQVVSPSLTKRQKGRNDSLASATSFSSTSSSESSAVLDLSASQKNTSRRNGKERRSSSSSSSRLPDNSDEEENSDSGLSPRRSKISNPRSSTSSCWTFPAGVSRSEQNQPTGKAHVQNSSDEDCTQLDARNQSNRPISPRTDVHDNDSDEEGGNKGTINLDDDELRDQVEGVMDRLNLESRQVAELLCLFPVQLEEWLKGNEDVHVSTAVTYWLRCMNDRGVLPPPGGVVTSNVDFSETPPHEFRVRLQIIVHMERYSLSPTQIATKADIPTPFVLFHWLRHADGQDVTLCSITVALAKWYLERVRSKVVDAAEKTTEYFSNKSWFRNVLSRFDKEVSAQQTLFEETSRNASLRPYLTLLSEQYMAAKDHVRFLQGEALVPKSAPSSLKESLHGASPSPTWQQYNHEEDTGHQTLAAKPSSLSTNIISDSSSRQTAVRYENPEPSSKDPSLYYPSGHSEADFPPMSRIRNGRKLQTRLLRLINYRKNLRDSPIDSRNFAKAFMVLLHFKRPTPVNMQSRSLDEPMNSRPTPNTVIQKSHDTSDSPGSLTQRNRHTTTSSASVYERKTLSQPIVSNQASLGQSSGSSLRGPDSHNKQPKQVPTASPTITPDQSASFLQNQRQAMEFYKQIEAQPALQNLMRQVKDLQQQHQNPQSLSQALNAIELRTQDSIHQLQQTDLQNQHPLFVQQSQQLQPQQWPEGLTLMPSLSLAQTSLTSAPVPFNQIMIQPHQQGMQLQTSSTQLNQTHSFPQPVNLGFFPLQQQQGNTSSNAHNQHHQTLDHFQALNFIPAGFPMRNFQCPPQR